MRRHCGLSRSAPATPMVVRWQSRRISAQLQALLRSAIAFLMMVPKGARVSASNHDDASLFPPAPRPLLKRVDTGRSTVHAANHSPVHDVTMGTLENGPGDLWPTCQVKNRRITSSHYLSASQEKRATGLRNDRRVGVGCGRLIASSVQLVCAAWRHSLASYLPTRSSKIGSRLERRRKHWAMARDFKHRSSGARMDFDSGFWSLPCKSCRPFEQGPLSWPLIG